MAKNKIWVAKLDKDKVLIGFIQKAKAGKNDIVVPNGCDLNCDGRYKWDGAAFVPLGHMFGKPKRPPIPDLQVLYLIAKATWDVQTQEVRDWCDWWDTNMSKQQEEIAKVKGV